MKKRISTLLLSMTLLTAPVLMAQWGNKVVGNGNVTTRTVTTSNYDEIKVVGSMDVHLEKGNEGTITITTDENLQDLVKVSSEGGELVLKMKKNTYAKTKKGIHITVPFNDLSEISLVGSGDIDSKDTIDATSLAVNVIGSGDVELTISTTNAEAKVTGSGDLVLGGTTDNLEVKVTGSGDFKGFDLDTQNTEVTVSGSGDAKVVAKKSIKARVNGSGDVVYKGNPSISDTKTNGSGDISSH